MTLPPSDPPTLTILPYERRVAALHAWDPRTTEVARRLGEFIGARRPDLVADHIGSTAVPGLPGKGIVDLSIETDADAHSNIANFQDDPSPRKGKDNRDEDADRLVK